MIPGTFTIWPREKNNPMDIYIFPIPGENPLNAEIEINRPSRLSLADFIVAEGFHLRYMGISVNGEGCSALNNTIEWPRSSCVGIAGGNHRIAGNTMLWGGQTGIGGSGASGCVIEDNEIRYADWRIFLAPFWGESRPV